MTATTHSRYLAWIGSPLGSQRQLIRTMRNTVRCPVCTSTYNNVEVGITKLKCTGYGHGFLCAMLIMGCMVASSVLLLARYLQAWETKTLPAYSWAFVLSIILFVSACLILVCFYPWLTCRAGHRGDQYLFERTYLVRLYPHAAPQHLALKNRSSINRSRLPGGLESLVKAPERPTNSSRNGR